jgi:hypothetical protein
VIAQEYPAFARTRILTLKMIADVMNIIFLADVTGRFE